MNKEIIEKLKLTIEFYKEKDEKIIHELNVIPWIFYHFSLSKNHLTFKFKFKVTFKQDKMLRRGDSQRKASMQRNETNARDNHGKEV